MGRFLKLLIIGICLPAFADKNLLKDEIAFSVSFMQAQVANRYSTAEINEPMGGYFYQQLDIIQFAQVLPQTPLKKKLLKRLSRPRPSGISASKVGEVKPIISGQMQQYEPTLAIGHSEKFKTVLRLPFYQIQTVAEKYFVPNEDFVYELKSMGFTELEMREMAQSFHESTEKEHFIVGDFTAASQYTLLENYGSKLSVIGAVSAPTSKINRTDTATYVKPGSGALTAMAGAQLELIFTGPLRSYFKVSHIRMGPNEIRLRKLEGENVQVEPVDIQSGNANTAQFSLKYQPHPIFSVTGSYDFFKKSSDSLKGDVDQLTKDFYETKTNIEVHALSLQSTLLLGADKGEEGLASPLAITLDYTNPIKNTYNVTTSQLSLSVGWLL